MNQTKLMRKLALFVLVFASLLTLAACSSSEKTPYGDISNDVYLTVGDVTVTEKELYDQLRLQGATVLANMIDEEVFATEIDAVKAILENVNDPLHEEYTKYFDEQVNTAIHGSTDLEALETLFNDAPERFTKNLATFVDSIYLLDNTVDKNALLVDLEALDPAYQNYASIPLLVERYALRSAQRYYAQDILADELTDEESDVYVEDETILSTYESSHMGRYDVNALIIRFINLNEANAALYKASIKADSKGFWYSIPDIRINDGEVGYVDLADTSADGYLHVREILSDLGILAKLDSDDDSSNGNDYLSRDKLSVLDYENYYKAYTISNTRENGRKDIALPTATVKEKFVEIYNYLTPQQLKVVAGEILYADTDEAFDSLLTYDDLTKMNASLRNHVYNTLLAEAQMEDAEDLTEGKPFSNRVQTFGTSRYLVFKLDDEKANEELIYDEDAEAFKDTPESIAKQAEIREELETAKLSNTYISAKINEKYEDVSIDIYDKVVRTLYKQNFVYDGTNKDRNGDLIAKVDGIEITVNDFFAKLEESYGINLALDIATNKYLEASDEYTITDDEYADFKKEFENIITQFSADSFAQAGYPASMGRETFILTAFGARTNKEAINQLYVYPELREQYLADYEQHYTFDVYRKLTELAALQFDSFKSITVSHLLVYFDANGDGSPDNPEEYLETLSAAERLEVETGLVDLVELVYHKVGNYTGHAAGLSALATEFNNSGRIERGNNVEPLTDEELRLDYQIELTWAKYRKLGFYLKFENISSAITNTSNILLSTSTSVLDQVFYDRAMELHEELMDAENDESLFPHLDLYGDLITLEALEEVQSSFGYHLILATRVTETTSAIYSRSDDTDDRYQSEDGILNIYNEDSEKITMNQVEFYIKQQNTKEGVILPPVVQTAITNYLSPILTRYSGTFMQRELIFKLLDNAVFADATNRDRFDMIREINNNQMNEYMIFTRKNAQNVNVTVVLDENYNDLYGTWFDILN
ncbi:MAG: hypothetical protein RBT45_02845 [Acholeplasmataceae bacterium]|jgi:hypothetical protein|nr:hypothetical protein [Acholeplasmataceae bacterium]